MASKRENIARPPTTTTIAPTPAHCGGPCRSADRRTHMCRRGKESERKRGQWRVGKCGQHFWCHGSHPQSQPLPLSTSAPALLFCFSGVDSGHKIEKTFHNNVHFEHGNTALHTHTYTSTHARTRTSHPRAALQTMRRRKCE